MRHAFRYLRRTPLVTTAALIILALAIGAAAATFTVVNGVLFRSLPYGGPEQLVDIGAMSLQRFSDYRAESRSFEGLASYTTGTKTLQGSSESEAVTTVTAESSLFDLLDVRAHSGRTFQSSDGSGVAVVNDGFWRRHFGGAVFSSGRAIVLDGEPHVVIGVMPKWFQFPARGAVVDVWLAAPLPRAVSPFQRIDAAVGRLRQGVSIDAARTELTAIAGGAESPTAAPLMDSIVGRSRANLLTLFGAVALVLVASGTNVAALLLLRGETRRHEVAVRLALGAGRARLFLHFLAEGLLMAAIAGGAAIGLAQLGVRGLLDLGAGQIPRANEIGLDAGTIAFVFAVALCVGILIAVVAWLQLARRDSGPIATLNRRGQPAGSTILAAKALIVGELALTFTLLAGSGLLLRAFLSLERTQTGLVASDVIVLRMETRGLVAGGDIAANDGTTAQGQYFRRIEERVSAVPGVQAVGFVTRLPLQSPGNLGQARLAGSDATTPALSVRMREVSTNYFRAFGIPLLAGRLFDERQSGQIIVNDALVQALFPGQDPIGRVLDRGVIVGVVGDVRQRLRLPAEPELYTSIGRTTYTAATLVVRTTSDGVAAAPAIRAAIHDVNAAQAILDTRTMADVIVQSHADVNLSLWLAGLFAIAAGTLAAIGIFAVASYGVALRHREFGIRLALGAGPGRLFRQVLAEGSALAAAGVGTGALLALGATRSLDALLYAVTPTDPLTFVAMALVVVGVALAACISPAVRAMTVDPAVTLRQDL